MSQSKNLSFVRLVNLITLGLLLVAAEPTLSQSRVNSLENPNDLIAEVLFEPPPDEGQPDDTSAAGTRGQCPQDIIATTSPDTASDKSSLMALVPTTNYGLTAVSRPTFWVYLPKTSARQVVLSIREEGKNYHSQIFMPIKGEAGIIGITPPNDFSSLEVGKNYQWAVLLVCGKRPGPNDPFVKAWVRHVDIPQSKQGTDLEKASWYGRQGIWYDALTALARARQEKPDNNALASIWADFLESVGLEEIAGKPLQF